MYGGVAEPEARARDRQARIQTPEVGREESIAGRPGSTCSAASLPRNRSAGPGACGAAYRPYALSKRLTGRQLGL